MSKPSFPAYVEKVVAAMRAAGGPRTYRELAESIDVPASSVKSAMNWLRKNGVTVHDAWSGAGNGHAAKIMSLEPFEAPPMFDRKRAKWEATYRRKRLRSLAHHRAAAPTAAYETAQRQYGPDHPYRKRFGESGELQRLKDVSGAQAIRERHALYRKRKGSED